MAFKCGCGKEFFQEESLLQHQKDAHGIDTSQKLHQIAELRKSEIPKPRRDFFQIPKKYFLIFVAFVAVAAIFLLYTQSTGAATQNNDVQVDASFLEIGDPNAPNVIEEFGDYECPFCARFHLNTFEQLKTDFIDTGKAIYIFKDFPIASTHINAQKASEAAHCAADQGKYLEYHDKLYQNSYSGDKWSNKPAINIFKKYAADIGLDIEKFNKCLDSGEKADEIRANFEEGKRRGVSGTPSFFVNGKLVVGAQPYNVFRQMLR